jgi:hypothetical protein
LIKTNRFAFDVSQLVATAQAGKLVASLNATYGDWSSARTARARRGEYRRSTATTLPRDVNVRVVVTRLADDACDDRFTRPTAHRPARQARA